MQLVLPGLEKADNFVICPGILLTFTHSYKPNVK